MRNWTMTFIHSNGFLSFVNVQYKFYNMTHTAYEVHHLASISTFFARPQQIIIHDTYRIWSSSSRIIFYLFRSSATDYHTRHIPHMKFIVSHHFLPFSLLRNRLSYTTHTDMKFIVLHQVLPFARTSAIDFHKWFISKSFFFIFFAKNFVSPIN